MRFTAELSADKRKIVVRIPDAGIGENVNEATSYKGLVESVLARKDGRSSLVTVQLRERSGFTAVLLPYSRAITIDAFDWDKLSPADDAYRSALLALDNGLYAQAVQMLQQAERAKHPDGTAHLGFLRIREEKFSEAKRLLLQAKQDNSTIPDIYAGLSLCARRSGDDAAARTYEQDFIRMTGRAPVFLSESPLVIPQTIEQQSEPPSLALSITEQQPQPQQDTALAQQKQDASIDTIINQQRRLKGSEQAVVSKETKSSSPLALMPSWMTSLLLGVGGSLVMVGILLLRGYGKWKRERLLAAAMYAQAAKQQPPAQPAADPFTTHFATAMSGTEQQAATAYQRSGNFVNRTDDDTTETRETITPTAEKQPEQPEQELFDFDEAYYREVEEKRRTRRQQPAVPDELFYQSTGSPATSLDAQSQPQESHNVFMQSGESLSNNDIEQLAKRLGIDPKILATLDTQKAADRLKQ